MPKPLTLSVGIPAYNQAKYLGATIDSLLLQTRRPDEIVVSDHYSTDATAEVLSRYGARVRVVQPPRGTNLTGQYNFTLSQLRGDWITLLSSDDVARPRFCEVLLGGALKSEDAVLVRSGWEQIDDAGQVLNSNYLLSVPAIETPPATLVSQRHGPKVNFAAFALRRTAFVESGPILETLESLADWALFLQMAPFGAFVYEHELIGGYRVGHDGNKFRDRLGMWARDQQRVFATVMPLAARRAGMPDTRWIAEASRYNLLRYLARASNEFSPAERAGVQEVFREWAEDAGAQRELQRFAEGGKIRSPIPLQRRLKNAMRPLLQRLLGRLRHR